MNQEKLADFVISVLSDDSGISSMSYDLLTALLDDVYPSLMDDISEIVVNLDDRFYLLREE